MRFPTAVLVPVLLAVACACRGEKRDGRASDRRDPARLGRAQLDQIRPGMTLSDVLGILGPHAEINPIPSPVAHLDTEVLVIWREGTDKWAVVVFLADEAGVLRVPNGATFVGWKGL